jgi:molecular chaperone GrpE
VNNLENEPDDAAEEDEQFSIAIDDSLLTEALAAVEKRMGRERRASEMDIGPLDLDALAAVEDELAIEIEEEEAEEQGPDMEQVSASVEARLRAMEAEQEAENLQKKLAGLSENRDNIEQQMRTLSSRAQKATEAQRLAEQRAKNLKGALEKQQKDVDKLLERRKREKVDEYNRGRASTLNAVADVIDNFVLALSHDDSDPERLLEGMRMCLDQFQTNLAQAGIETIAPKPGDAFDPEWHEAIATEAAEGIDTGCVVSMMSRGYVADGKLIRAARVAVSED